jgi:hypothetical protein
MKQMLKFLPLVGTAAILTIVFGTIYVITQQSLRLGANDPQIQLAEDAAAALDAGQKPGDLTRGRMDMGASLQPFIIIYDKSGKPVAGNGYLDGKLPQVPVSVLEASKGQERNSITWQPASDVRVASVTVASKDYYVTSGRSLREVESRESAVFKLAASGWAASIFVLVVVALLAREPAPKSASK